MDGTSCSWENQKDVFLMKIGIVTFYDAPNYGAMLQAYALWKYLEARGHQVKFIKIPFRNTRRIPLWRCFVSRSFKGIKVKLNKHVRFFITDFALRYPKGLPNGDYDAVIVGSDQMWNPKWVLPWLKEVFLDFVPPSCQRIAYAPSFGVKEWGESKREEVGALLKKFSSISVREESGINIVRDLSGRDTTCLLDPTLLQNAKFYQEIMDEVTQKDSYIFAYFLDEWADGADERKALKQCCDVLGVNIVKTDKCAVKGWFLGLLCHGLGIKGKISLRHWLSSIATAQFVITNSFHGTVFAILFHRPFVSLLLKGCAGDMNDRVVSLLTKLGLEKRMCYADEIGKVKLLSQDKIINWQDVDSRLDCMRESSDCFFDNL